jgi:hypothetical protein
MSNMPSSEEFAGAVASGSTDATAVRLQIDETYWGYIIRTEEADPALLVIGQLVAWCFGAGFAVAALGLWMIPAMTFGGDALSMRLGASVVFGAMSFLLLWFASRGARTELQVDTSLGEVREVVRNRAGRATLLGRYGFDSIGGIFLDRKTGKSGEACLVMRYRNTAQVLPVARGPQAHLERLRDRMGRDLLVDVSTRRRVPAEFTYLRGAAA